MASGSSSSRASTSEEASPVRARLVLQQCLSAKLMVQPRTDTQEEQFVEVHGITFIFLCVCVYIEEELLIILTLNLQLLNFLNGITYLSYLKLFIIILRDVKMGT